MFKDYKDKTRKNYRILQYVVIYVNKGNGKVWIRPFKKMCYFYWSQNPNDLIKVPLTQ